MKPKKSTALLAPLIVVGFCFCIFAVFKNKNYSAKPEVFHQEGLENPAEEFSEALEDERNLLKDRHTGKIPEGIRELELMQAKEILEAQMQNGYASKTNNSIYTYQGPTNLGGRTRAVVFDVADPTSNTILAGGVSGGVFKTINGGASWTRVSPDGDGNFTVTAIAQDTRVGFTNIWYYAGGEGLGNSASGDGDPYFGNGVYKSVDNGNTWTRLANSNTGSSYVFDRSTDAIFRIAVHPITGEVYLAALGMIMRSQDGGSHWSAILSAASSSSSSQATDVLITSTGMIYVAFTGSTSNGNSPALDGVWSSTSGNFGSFTHIAGTGSATTPAGWHAYGAYGRVILGVAPSNQNLLFALYDNKRVSNCSGVAAPEADLFKWDESTDTWTNLSALLPDEAGCSDGNDPMAVQGGYDLALAVKPDDPNTLVIGGTNVYRSVNGGTSWTRIGGFTNTSGYAQLVNHHPDIHVLTFKPSDVTKLFCGDDGGIQMTDISAAAPVWTSLNNNFYSYQYYHVAIKQEAGLDDFIGGAQDNGITFASAGSTSFSTVLTGDGGAVGFGSGINPYREYCSSQRGKIYRVTRSNSSTSTSELTPPGVSSLFVTYFLVDPDNTELLYYSGSSGGLYRLLRITNASAATNGSWQTFSFGFQGFIRAMATTRGTYSASSCLYLGTESGYLYRLTDPANAPLGTVPVDITPPGMEGMASILGIGVNPRNANEILVAFSNYGAINIWYTANAGAASPTWVNVEGNLTLPSVRSAMILNSASGPEYYVGTSVGLYKSTLMNGSATVWTKEAPSEIGNVQVRSLSLRPSDNTFAIGTHGLGMWKGKVPVALPVQFTYFSGVLKNNSAQLKWTTAQENNNKGFELERSYDGLHYQKIAFVKGAGTTSISQSYMFTDKEIAQDNNYYRLRQLDFDGKATYSSIVLLRNTLSMNADVTVLGNPFTDHLDIRFNKRMSSELFFRLTDMSGRIVHEENVGNGNTKVRLSFGPIIVSGVYVLSITDGTKQYNIRVVKK